MPRADHGRAVQLAFTQRAATMAADIVDCVEFAVDVEDADGFAVDFDALAAAGL